MLCPHKTEAMGKSLTLIPLYFVSFKAILIRLRTMQTINYISFLVLGMLFSYAQGEQYLRALPGAEDYFDMNRFSSTELGFAAGVSATILFLIVFICCCCCGRWSLWDVVALVCIWDMCCDRRGVDPGFLAL
jgi:hypothetical protein